MKNIQLNNSVGQGGANNPKDVKAVQSALKRVGFDVSVDGKLGNETLSAINRFQKIVLNGFADGLISPDKGTMNKLNETKDGSLAGFPDVEVVFGRNAQPEAVGNFFKNLLISAAKSAGEDKMTITSTARQPADQARAMYENISKTGVQAQKKLYGKYGDMVVDAYVEAQNAGRDSAGIQAAMVKRIIEIGPSKVSKHMSSDIDKVQVVDISPRSISNNAAFVAAITKMVAEGKIKTFLHPGNSKDPAYHIVVNPPQEA